ncbi:unnamed protein product [Rhizophagus irregularis]|nr:unnamed protein product [Rhizophagus irregularis]
MGKNSKVHFWKRKRAHEINEQTTSLHIWCYTKGSKSSFKVKVGMDNDLFDLIVRQKKRTTLSSIVIVKLPDVTYAEKLNLKIKSGSASLYSPYTLNLGESIDETYYNLPTIRGPDSSIVFLKRFLHYNYYNWFTCDSKEYFHEKRNKKIKKIKNLLWMQMLKRAF